MTSKRKRKHIVTSGGPPCPRCQRETEVRAHAAITDKQRRQPFYYSRWFYCTNRACKTTLIMPEEFRVYRDEATRAAFEGETSAHCYEDVCLDVLDQIGDAASASNPEQEAPPWED